MLAVVLGENDRSTRARRAGCGVLHTEDGAFVEASVALRVENPFE